MSEFWVWVFTSAICFAPSGIGLYLLGYCRGKRKDDR